MTNSATGEALGKMLEAVARFRVKATIDIRADSKRPMSVVVTDHRNTNIPVADLRSLKLMYTRISLITSKFPSVF